MRTRTRPKRPADAYPLFFIISYATSWRTSTFTARGTSRWESVTWPADTINTFFPLPAACPPANAPRSVLFVKYLRKKKNDGYLEETRFRRNGLVRWAARLANLTELPPPARCRHQILSLSTQPQTQPAGHAYNLDTAPPRNQLPPTGVCIYVLALPLQEGTENTTTACFSYAPRDNHHLCALPSRPSRPTWRGFVHIYKYIVLVSLLIKS